MMHKEKTAQDGVQILGYNKLGKENVTNKGKQNNEGKNTKKQKEIIGSNSTVNGDSTNPSQAQVSQGNESKDEQSK